MALILLSAFLTACGKEEKTEESIAVVNLFIYLSEGAMITGYFGIELIVAKTWDYFLPPLRCALSFRQPAGASSGT